MLDLEDAVANAEKIGARASTRAALPTYLENVAVVVRVNGVHTGLMEGDIEAVVCSELDCIMVPKVENVETLRAVDSLVGRLEQERGFPRDRSASCR